MADFAGRRESGRRVRRTVGTRVVLLVARVTQCAVQIVIVVHVAVGTSSRWHGVTSGEWEAGGAVIKRGIQPGASAVALVASLREIRADVVGISRSLVVLQVTRNAGVGGQIVIVVDVAIGASARRDCVQARQDKAGRGVIKLGVGPLHGIVALLAGRREPRMGNW